MCIYVHTFLLYFYKSSDTINIIGDTLCKNLGVDIIILLCYAHTRKESEAIEIILDFKSQQYKYKIVIV